MRVFLTALMVVAATVSAEPPAGMKKVRLRLKWHHQFQFAGYYAAQIEGFYKDAGLDVELVEGTPQKSALQAVLSREVDFGVTDSDVLLARLRGEPVVVCAAIFQHSPYIMLALARSGITKPSDLVDKRLMVGTTQGEAEVRAMVMREGLPEKRLHFLPHSWRSQDLVDNKVDALSAYITVEPFVLKGLGHAPAIIRFSDYGVDFYGDTLFTHEEVVRRDHAMVTAFVKASLEGWNHAMAHPEEIVEHILQMPGVKERTSRQNLLNEARAMIPLIQADLIEMGHMNVGRWERIANTFVETGVIKGNVNLNGFMLKPDRQPDLTPFAWGVAILAVLGGLGVVWTLQLRKQVELRTREVKEGQRTLSAILDNTFQFQGLLDPEGRLVEANNTALTFANVQLVDVMGKWFWDTVWWIHAPAEQDKLRKAVQQIQQGQDCVRFETFHPDRAGARHAIDFSMRAVRAEGGKLRYLMVEGYDITDRKKAEDARKVSEANLLALLENSSGAIWSLDKELRYLTFNSRYLDHILAQGGNRAEIGQLAREVEPKHHFALWHPHYLRALKGERFREVFTQELQGRTRSFQASFNPIRHGGEVTGVSVFSDDVTDQKQLEEQLRQSQKMDAIGQLAGGVAHDFNNLLTVIQANASLARITKLSPEMTARAFNEIMEASNRASTLTRQLLTFSRQQTVNKTTLNLNQTMGEMHRMLQRLIGEHIQVNLRLHPSPLLIHADASMMEQTVLNLAVNARDAMPNGGQLTLTTRPLSLRQLPPQAPASAQPGEYVCLEVRDTGTGISPEHLTRIFEPFFTTKAVGQGTGIGLATVFGIAQQHGGWITVESQPGAGACFCVFLPALASPVQAPADEEITVPAAALGATGSGTILIVEDETTVRTIVKHVLSNHGYRVKEAVTGKEALEMWDEIGSAIDLLLTDMVMPGGVSGSQLADRLTQLKPELKVIYTSGYSAETFRRDSVLSEDAILLRKPYTAAQLLKEVQKLLAPETPGS